METVSVIIPTFEGGRFLNKALTHLKSQSISDWELILVDDASTDDTREIVNSFKQTVSNRVLYIKNEKNQGVAHSRNKAMRHASGDVFAFLDADDFWSENHLEEGLKTLNREFDLCYSGVYIYDREREEIIPYLHRVQNSHLALFKRNFIYTSSSVMITSEVAKKLNGFIEGVKVGEDWDFWFRALLNKFKLGYTGATTCFYNKHRANTMTQTLTVSKDIINFYRRYIDLEIIPFNVRKQHLAQSLVNYAKLIAREQPNQAIRNLYEAWRYRPIAIHYLMYIGYASFLILRKG